MVTTMVTMAARPGVRFGSFASSFIVTTVSQPQKRKIASETPADMAERLDAASGLNQSAVTGCGSNPSPCPTATNAAIAYQTSAPTWKTTRPICTFFVASTPR